MWFWQPNAISSSQFRHYPFFDYMFCASFSSIFFATFGALLFHDVNLIFSDIFESIRNAEIACFFFACMLGCNGNRMCVVSVAVDDRQSFSFYFFLTFSFDFRSALAFVGYLLPQPRFIHILFRNWKFIYTLGVSTASAHGNQECTDEQCVAASSTCAWRIK